MDKIKYITPRYENLTRIAKEIQAKTFLEIGTWSGVTAQNLILTAKGYAPDEEIFYSGIDLFELLTPKLKKSEYSKEPKTYSDVLTKLWALGVPMELHRGFSHDVLLILPDQEFDVIYIDGGHRAKTIVRDWEDVQRFIGKNTVVVFDDYRHDHPGVGCKNLVDNLDPEKWDVEILEPTETFKFGKLNMVKICKT